ncbi:glycoside hydrolase family 38 C-terminal domain-containing protein [Synechococcus sp. TAK9802]|uniref:alpha-mannosidase n=1 Tax=Synechococcus sp. TAK9802 TaxID=1442558 RepID=UPI00185F368A|nr:glycoside hydrolase family 38 C-terminal domain-containing protein [Synechococcus sp. TAK9802]QNI60571.1 alpha-mannosidases/ glycoside hydrolase family 38 [Synechococcus sp. TAK9802]
MNPDQVGRSEWIETFRSRSRRDLHSGWRRSGAAQAGFFLNESWGATHRPDWAKRGLLIWPRGRQWLRLEQRLSWPDGWSASDSCRARLVLSWWAEQMRLWVDGVLVHEGDLFDTACRWPLPQRCRQGAALDLVLELCSPLHDDGALISSHLDLEPQTAGLDPEGTLLPAALELHLAMDRDLPPHWADLDPSSAGAQAAVAAHLLQAEPPRGSLHWLGHAHLDLAWLWPVADTWQAAERTFRSALALMRRWPELRFAHSTPALYAWVEQHRPALFAEIQVASRAGRWEPINGPWVETDCVLVSTASLWNQFVLGQDDSRRRFPEWTHELAWLPDSFGFAAGLPAVAAATGVRWFCTHKLAWNADNPFPHRLFRWRARGRAELRSLMLPPIGRRADPLEMLNEQRAWHQNTGLEAALWIPGVGDHGGGPTEELLEQIELWEGHAAALPTRAGTVREFLTELEQGDQTWPVWRDELFLELHRGCATSRPDQKRHNRTLERLLREADVVSALLAIAGRDSGSSDWRPLLFQQFHDILPGTSIPEVFDQAETVWRSARRQARQERDRRLARLPRPENTAAVWSWWGLQPLASWSPLVRLPAVSWLADAVSLPQQNAAAGGTWVQLPRQHGICSVPLRREPDLTSCAAQPRQPVVIRSLGAGAWRVGNGLIELDVSSAGLLALRDRDGRNQLSSSLQLERYRDRGEFWDAWDLAADYRSQPLGVLCTDSLEWLDQGPLVAHLVLRRQLGASCMRLDLRLKADTPWLELICGIDWRQTHELLRLELPLATPAVRIAADTSGGVVERPAAPMTAREQARWEVPVISWFASQSAAPGGGMAVLLDGPQGVDWSSDRLGISLLRGPTWPDPSADQGWHRQRLALMPFAGSWSDAGVSQAAIAFREPGWCADLPAEQRQWFPSLPFPLTPVGLERHADGCMLKLLNSGSARCRWTPGAGWRVRREADSIAASAVVITPGELVSLVVDQSS